jgi:hypothetical protein
MKAVWLKRGTVSLFSQVSEDFVCVGAAEIDREVGGGLGASIGHVDVSVCFFTALSLIVTLRTPFLFPNTIPNELSIYNFKLK